LSVMNMTGHGDQLELMGMKSLGDGDAYLGYVGYETPVNATGTKVQAYAFTGNVAIGQEFRVLEIEGDSEGWGIGVSQDYLLASRTLLTLEAWFEGQDLEQTLLGTPTARDRVRKFRVGATYDRSDLYGRTLLSVDLHQGLGTWFGGMAEDSVLSSRSYAEADNEFTKLTFDLARLQRINSRFVIIPRLYGQYAFDSVVAGEQWAIGGFNSVLGHPASAYSGDSGYTARVEGRYALFEDDDRYQFIMRADHGQVFVKRPYLGQEDEEAISGIGIGLLAQPIEAVELRVDWGVPVGEETEDDSYVYGQATYRF
ncbi:MAG: ShlB/FhaC/HecB family hemolysin secretion/activation protein, partial [Halomonas sp.]|nr:ShlB/FhaC/HecB family hemolysin secretion/activation protein [Halomonas sp.]